MIQLIATDIDGTLLDDNRFVSQRTVGVFKKLAIPKILISARMPHAMYYLQDTLSLNGLPIICYNGALIVHNNQKLYQLCTTHDTLVRLAQIGLKNNLHVSIYRNDEWFVTAMDQWALREIRNTRVQPIVQDIQVTLEYFKNTQDAGGAHKIMFMGDAACMDSAFAEASTLRAFVHCYRSKDTYTEITPAGTSKKVALEKLLQMVYPDVGMDTVAAFGDNYNDIDMIEAVGYGVCVLNGRDELKAVAGFVAGHHKEDGVAIWLESTLDLVHEKSS